MSGSTQNQVQATNNQVAVRNSPKDLYEETDDNEEMKKFAVEGIGITENGEVGKGKKGNAKYRSVHGSFTATMGTGESSFKVIDASRKDAGLEKIHATLKADGGKVYCEMDPGIGGQAEFKVTEEKKSSCMIV